jgi:hypothetical protein
MLNLGKRKWLITTVCIAAALVGLLVLSLFIPIFEDMCTKNEYTGQKECATYHITPFIVLYIGKFLETNNGAVTALATCFIAWFTLILWRATTEQGRLTQQSIDLVRDEFISTQRPRINIRQIAIWHPSRFDNFMNGEPFQFIADEKIHGRVFIANVGATRATVDFFCNIFYWKEPSFPMLYPYDTLEILRQEPPIILERGQRMTLHGLAGGPLGISVIDNIGIGKTKLYVMGCVRYRDDRNVIRETRFCRLWNNSERRFTVVDNPDYEYSD